MGWNGRDRDGEVPDMPALPSLAPFLIIFLDFFDFALFNDFLASYLILQIYLVFFLSFFHKVTPLPPFYFDPEYRCSSVGSSPEQSL